MSDWVDASMPALEFLRSRLAALVGSANYFVHHFESLVTSGRFLFLLDGLNELPGRHASAAEGRHEQSPGQHDQPRDLAPRPGPGMDSRERSLRELAAQAAVQCPFILTCRSHEYFDSMQWVAIEVLPMDDRRIEEFIGAYLPADEAAGLVARVAEDPDLRALAANPFFLASIIIVCHRPGIDLGSRGQVLQHLLSTLLTRETERGADLGVEEHELAERVGRVAFRMLRHGAIGNQAAIDLRGEREARDLRSLVGTGLVVDRQGSLFFCHQIVQEFFAACALRRRRLPGLMKTLLADARYSETVLVWRDLDPERMQRRLVRALRARNLPWRRPVSLGNRSQQSFQMASTIAIILVALWYLLDRVTWHADVMSLRGLLPVPVGVLLLAVVALQLIWKVLVYHQKVIVNASYVLSQTRRPAAIIQLVKSFPRVFTTPRQEIAQSVAALGPAATPHVVAGLGSNNWRVRWGCVQALGEILRRRPDDALATRSILLLSRAEDPKLVRPLTEALSWCRDPGCRARSRPWSSWPAAARSLPAAGSSR